jgi:para-aminobenzoate synthetase component 2
MLLLIDNYDSFTYNLVQIFQKLGIEVVVVRNNKATVEKCLEMDPTHLVISPGPGNPSESGISKDIIRACILKKIPLLGVCLGHQCLAAVFQGKIIPSPHGPMHGKTSTIFHHNKGIFKDIPNEFIAARYHSLVVERASLPFQLEITAETQEGEIMGLRHRNFPLEGLQFHPESIMTSVGPLLLKNFISSPKG